MSYGYNTLERLLRSVENSGDASIFFSLQTAREIKDIQLTKCFRLRISPKNQQILRTKTLKKIDKNLREKSR
jgi:hypothetical protein